DCKTQLPLVDRVDQCSYKYARTFDSNKAVTPVSHSLCTSCFLSQNCDCGATVGYRTALSRLLSLLCQVNLPLCLSARLQAGLPLLISSIVACRNLTMWSGLAPIAANLSTVSTIIGIILAVSSSRAVSSR